MRRVVTAFAAVAALACGAAVLKLKLVVQEKADDVRALAAQIHDDREAIRVLEAEWSYLTTPRALQDQSVKFLALMPPKATQVMAEPDRIPFRPKDADPVEDPGVLLPAASNQKDDKKTDKSTRNTKGHSL
ncbi:MAG: hypothetical protein EP335_11360 [Alphaproteobacteria bacterium]|nr:MAG: hypothetical protein EP335_11360 [Alphaproteobacteria bacterium]